MVNAVQQVIRGPSIKYYRETPDNHSKGNLSSTNITTSYKYHFTSHLLARFLSKILPSHMDTSNDTQWSFYGCLMDQKPQHNYPTGPLNWAIKLPAYQKQGSLCDLIGHHKRCHLWSWTQWSHTPDQIKRRPSSLGSLGSLALAVQRQDGGIE